MRKESKLGFIPGHIAYGLAENIPTHLFVGLRALENIRFTLLGVQNEYTLTM